MIIILLLIIRFHKYKISLCLILTAIKVNMVYWIVIINIILSFIIINIWNNSNIYIQLIVNNKISALSWFMVTIVILISSCIIHNSIDYLSIMDSYPFIIYIILFQLSMINFVLSYDIILTFVYWDMIGIFSYLLINYWSSKLNCGIKAVLYNKIGDNFFILLLLLFYSFLSFIAFSLSLPYSICIPFSLYYYSFIISTIYSCSFIIIFIFYYFPFSILFILFSKSAQLPFSSWLLNAINAPTPISASSHSSTMVIAGVYLSIIIDDYIIVIIDYCSLFLLIFYIIPLYTLLWSLFKAISLSDIKSIIALSTISQLSYMFIALLINPLLCLYHIIIHALFKSMLFILSGSIIHIQYNYQNIYKIKINNRLYLIIYILISNILIISLSKESIIHNIYLFINSPYSFITLNLGAVLTVVYSAKIFIYCFIY